jgi:hypothetical protein
MDPMGRRLFWSAGSTAATRPCFWGPDAVVVTAAEQAEQDRATGRRIDLVQSALEKDRDDSAARGI